MLRPRHPSGQSGGKGFARSVAPSRLSPHWAQLSDLLSPSPIPETIPNYWYFSNAPSSLDSYFYSYICCYIFMLFWFNFTATSSVTLCFFSMEIKCVRGEGRKRRPDACSCVLQGDGGQCLSFDHGQTMSIWVPWCQGHCANLLSTLDVKSSTRDMSTILETWTQWG